MDNPKATSNKAYTKLDSKVIKKNPRELKISKVKHDRPAIFIEELKNDNQFSH